MRRISEAPQMQAKDLALLVAFTHLSHADAIEKGAHEYRADLWCLKK